MLQNLGFVWLLIDQPFRKIQWSISRNNGILLYFHLAIGQ